MSRYSRSFHDKSAEQTRIADLPGYSRYREQVAALEQIACQLCDGEGQYSSEAGIVDCDLCDGSGALAADAQVEIPMFRSRNRD